jgi:hypothetical protein
MNEIVNGDFEEVDPEDGRVPLIFEDNEDAEMAAGAWVSSRRYQSHGPWSHEPCSTEEDHNVCVDYNGTLKQLFRVAPGEPYRLSFSVDETTLPEDASFTVAMAFYDESFEQLGFRHPVKGVEVDEIQEYNIGSFPPDTAARH